MAFSGDRTSARRKAIERIAAPCGTPAASAAVWVPASPGRDPGEIRTGARTAWLGGLRVALTFQAFIRGAAASVPIFPVLM